MYYYFVGFWFTKHEWDMYRRRGQDCQNLSQEIAEWSLIGIDQR